MRRFAELGSFQNVVAGSKATLDLPVDRRYHALKIGYIAGAGAVAATRATMEADISLIRLLLDGVVQWELSAAQYFAILDIHGYPVTSGVIPLHFSEPWRRSPQGEDNLAWAVAGEVRTFQVEIEIAGAAVSPKLECFCEFDNIAAPLAPIRKYTRQQVPVAATGFHTLDQIPGIGNLHALHCFEAADGDVKSIRFERQQQIVYEAPRYIADELQKAHGGSPVSGVFTLRFDRTERVSDTLENQLRTPNGGIARVPVRAMFDMANASPFTLLYEFVGGKN